MRPTRLLLLVAAVVAACLGAGFGPPVLTDADVPQRLVTRHQLTAWRDDTCPYVTAAASLLVNVSTGQILCAQNEHERRAPASFVKVATALVALEHTRQDDKVMITGPDLATPSMVNLMKNQEYTMRELLLALLLPSDNAAALAIARHAAGNVETFVGWMNDYAAALGLQDTHFTNPHGLDEEGLYMSAYDAAILARHAMSVPAFADIVGRRDGLIGAYLWPSTNQLYGQYPGVMGVKTGTTDNAGDCFIGWVRRPQGELLTVVMGSEDRWADTKQLLNYYYATRAEVRVDLPENALNRYMDEHGEWHTLYLREPATLLTHPADARCVTYYRRLDNPTATPNPEEPVGSLVVLQDGRYLTEYPMYAR